MKIQFKLFLILFSFSLLLVTSLVLFMQWNIGKGMVNYVNTKEVEALKPVVTKLAALYQEDNNWLFLQNNNDIFRKMIGEQLDQSDFSMDIERPKDRRRLNSHDVNDIKPRGKSHGRPAPQPRSKDMPPKFHDRKTPPPPSAVLDLDKNQIVGRYLPELEYTFTDIKVDKKVIGYLVVSKRNRLTQGYEIAFVEQQQYTLWIIAFIAMLLVVLITLPLSRHLVEPIKLINLGMHKLTQGDYQHSVQLPRRDELGQMARDYNELALTLAENESARKRWLANISHELRTPVAILRGELEAMLDNVRPMSKTNISSANDEVIHLQRLIDDLNLLTIADVGGMSYRKQNEELSQLLKGEKDKYRRYLSKTGISLSYELLEQKIEVYVDKNRIFQLFENIIDNCNKYSSATQLLVSLTLEQTESEPCVIIKFIDNGIGVDEEHLASLFEHLYRVDASRNRKTGGSGLGLAICKQIVLAHQGEISAVHSDFGGLTIVIKLPIGVV